MKISERFKGNWLKAADLSGKARRYTIESVTSEKVGDDQKVVVRFLGCDQGFVLNKTNSSIMSAAFGDETEDWAGKEIVLKPEKTTFSGKLVDCVRVAVPTKKTPPDPKETEGGEEVNF